MDVGEMIELMKEEVMLGSDFSQIDFLFDNTAMALAELYFQWKDNGKLDYDHEEAVWDKVTGFTASSRLVNLLSSYKHLNRSQIFQNTKSEPLA